MLVHFLMILTAGALGGIVCKRLKVPAGLMVGALIGSALLSLSYQAVPMPSGIRIFAQIITGMTIAQNFDRTIFQQLKGIARPCILLVAAYLVFMLAFGFVINHLRPDISLATCLLMCMPAGLSDAAIIAPDFKAHAASITVIQLLRIVLGLLLLPLIMTFLGKAKKANRPSRETKSRHSFDKSRIREMFSIAAYGTFFGLLGYWSGIPAAALSFTVVGVAAIKIMFNCGYVPPGIRRFVLILNGCYIGSQIRMEDIEILSGLLVPALIVGLGYMSFCLIGALVLVRCTRFGKEESFFMTWPIGGSDAALLTEEMGICGANIVLLQLLRVMLILAFFPQIIHIVTMYWDMGTA